MSDVKATHGEKTIKYLGTQLVGKMRENKKSILTKENNGRTIVYWQE
jgi:hypothetical protein